MPSRASRTKSNAKPPAAARRTVRVPAPDARFPDWVGPMLATLADAREFDLINRKSPNRWVVERKLDGFRALAFRQGGQLRLLSRNRNDLGVKFPEIAEALGRQPLDDFIVDGEVVAIAPGRGTGANAPISFELLQQRLAVVSLAEARKKGIRLAYFAFDLLRAAGHDVRGLPLLERKRLLKQALAFDSTIRFLPHERLSPSMNLDAAAERGWEGLVAKEADGAYVAQRSRSWLKLKCAARQELVIGGWTEPSGSRSDFGALLVGYYDARQRLMYAGRVGTGFSTALLKSIGRTLAAMKVKACPFQPDAELPKSNVHWTRPELVAEIAFGEWTSDNKLRHPRFLGLRPDKSADTVIRETPAPVE